MPGAVYPNVQNIPTPDVCYLQNVRFSSEPCSFFLGKRIYIVVNLVSCGLARRGETLLIYPFYLWLGELCVRTPECFASLARIPSFLVASQYPEGSNHPANLLSCSQGQHGQPPFASCHSFVFNWICIQLQHRTVECIKQQDYAAHQ